ncbi:MAG: acyl-CoA dehydrogenase, partial [Frateuria sp.]|nr:acyl-CoA dehydrogenase [Frateuria sp.]
GGERDALEASARGLATTLARCAAAALLARQSTFARERSDMRPGAALRRFVANGLDRLATTDAADTRLLL